MAKSKKTRKTNGSAVKTNGSAVKTTRPLPTANIVARHIGATTADVSDYVRAKTAAGNVSLHNGDRVAKALAGKPIEDAYKAAAEAVGETQVSLRSRYNHLNLGMQRMCLGNLVRGAMSKAAA